MRASETSSARNETVTPQPKGGAWRQSRQCNTFKIVVTRSAILALGLFILNFVWEMAQAGYYASMTGLPFWSATWLCTRAAAADLALLTLFFVIAALVARDALWPLRPTLRATTTFFVACFLATAGIERWALATRRWSYSEDMPLIFGVGALPLLQWVLIPALAVLLFRLAFGRALPGSDESMRDGPKGVFRKTRL